MSDGQLYVRPEAQRLYVEIPLRRPYTSETMNTIAFDHNFAGKRRHNWTVSASDVGREIFRAEDPRASS